MEYQSPAGKRLFKQIKPGEVFLVGQSTPHQLDWQQKAELTLFYLHPQFFSSILNDSIENYQLEIRDCFSLTNDALIQQVGAIFRHLCNLDNGSERLYIESLTNLLAVHLIKNYLKCKVDITKNHQKLSRKKTTQILEYIEANLDTKIVLSDLADVARLVNFIFVACLKALLILLPTNMFCNEE
ncbi:MAG: hypothetical protein AAGF83_03020 [Cyanobacteria bacterium P01_G01_bin.67]